MHLKITTDGTSIGTKIINTDTGEHLEGQCAGVTIHIRPDRVHAELILLCGVSCKFEGNFMVLESTEDNQKGDERGYRY